MTYANLNPTSMQFSNHIVIEMSNAFGAYRETLAHKSIEVTQTEVEIHIVYERNILQNPTHTHTHEHIERKR